MVDEPLRAPTVREWVRSDGKPERTHSLTVGALKDVAFGDWGLPAAGLAVYDVEVEGLA